jgi:hypothetical protein
VVVLFGYGYHKPQVGFHEFLQGLLVALFDAAGQVYFLVRREQFYFRDFVEVLLDGRTIPVGDLIGNF